MVFRSLQSVSMAGIITTILVKVKLFLNLAYIVILSNFVYDIYLLFIYLRISQHLRDFIRSTKLYLIIDGDGDVGSFVHILRISC